VSSSTAETTHVPALAARDGARPRRSLILAGGGMRVAYQAGVLRALEEEGLTFFHVDGTSGGTINLAMLLSGLTPAEMCERWRTLHVRDFVSFLPIRTYLRSIDWPAFGGANGLARRVYPQLGIDVARIRAARGLTGTFNVCNYTEKTNRAVPNCEAEEELLVAGVSLPMAMPPVPHDGALYVDSVWIKDANPTEAVRRGAEELWLVWCIGNSGVYRSGAFQQYVHMIELSANGGLFEELAHLAAELGDARPRLHVIKPEYPLPLDPDFYFGRIDATALVATGYRDAKRYLAAIPAAGLPYEPGVTRMRDPLPGVAFVERLAGSVELDGREVALSVEVRVEIRDAERFLSGQTRSAECVGVVDGPFGRGVPAAEAAFDLDGRRLIYRLVLTAGGRERCVVARVPARPWGRAETSVHEGRSPEGPQIGGGRLRFGSRDALARVRSICATGPAARAERAETVARTARLLLGG
jgi:predicted acylesterase/phospholipase RssA